MTAPQKPNPYPIAAPTPDVHVLAGWMDEIRHSFATIAVLNERHANNERRLAEAEDRTANSLAQITQEISKVHQRLDNMNLTVREEVSVVREELRNFSDTHRQETTQQIEKICGPIKSKLDIVAINAEETKKELDGWINRVKGGWFIASICAGIFQICICGALVWSMNEVKTLHDWRIQVETRNEQKTLQTQK